MTSPAQRAFYKRDALMAIWRCREREWKREGLSSAPPRRTPRRRRSFALALAVAVALAAASPACRLWAPFVFSALAGRATTRAWPPLADDAIAPDAVPTPGRGAVDLSRPLLLRRAADDAVGLFSAAALQRPPLGDVVIDFFVDASRPAR